MTFIETIELKNKLELITDNLSDKLNSFPRSNSGLVSDEVRTSDAYRALKSEFSKAFENQKVIAKYGQKHFKKEMRDYSMAKRFKKGDEFLKQFS